jgi:hypothetical protein
MAPEAGLEPATFRLTAGRSTIELLWNKICFATGRKPRQAPNLQGQTSLVKRFLNRFQVNVEIFN